MWMGSLFLMLSMVLVVHPLTQHDYSKGLIPWDPLYITFSRPLWSASICWLIFACYTGHGGKLKETKASSSERYFSDIIKTEYFSSID